MKKPSTWATVADLLGGIAGADAKVPASIEAEQALLGAILANNRAHELVSEFLAPEHFADPINGRIYQSIARRIEAGRLADAVTLKTELENAGVLDEVGGTAYLAQLLTAMVGIINAGEYGRTIHDTWLRRQAMEAGAALIHDALVLPDVGSQGRTVLGHASDAISDLVESASAADRSRSGTLGHAVASVIAAADRRHKEGPGKGDGLFSGIESLDAAWRGMWPGQMTMLAGRSGHGKTALASQIMRHTAAGFVAAVAGTETPPSRVLMFSLEMSRDEIAARMLSFETGIPTDDIIAGNLKGNDAFDMLQAQRALEDLPFDIHDERKMTAREIVAVATAAVRRRHVKLIVVDHLHRIQGEPGRRPADVTQAVQGAAKAMKDFAGTMGVHVLLLAQIASRSADHGSDDPRPRLAQIAYGGEAEADDALLVWRPEIHLGKEPPANPKANAATQANAKAEWWRQANDARGKAEVILAKRRFGSVGAVMLRFDGKRGRFSDLPIDPGQGPMPGLWDEEMPAWGQPS